MAPVRRRRTSAGRGRRCAASNRSWPASPVRRQPHRRAIGRTPACSAAAASRAPELPCAVDTRHEPRSSITRRMCRTTTSASAGRTIQGSGMRANARTRTGRMNRGHVELEPRSRVEPSAARIPGLGGCANLARCITNRSPGPGRMCCQNTTGDASTFHASNISIATVAVDAMWSRSWLTAVATPLVPPVVIVMSRRAHGLSKSRADTAMVVPPRTIGARPLNSSNVT